MTMRIGRRAGAALFGALALLAASAAAALEAAAVNEARFEAGTARAADGPDPVVLRAQILLDRAGFSPGEIDGRDGDNTRKALAAFAEANGLPGGRELDAALFQALVERDGDPVLTRYRITAKDADERFVPEIPEAMEEQAELDRLGYRNAAEMLGERFHMAPALLRVLNPGVDLTRAGAEIVVAAVAEPDGRAGKPEAARIEIDKPARRLSAFDGDGRLLAVFPASIGSAEKPAPSGRAAVRGVARRPTYTYDPAFAFKGVRAREKFEIAPGPNNPVGLVWIDLDIPSYGIHGTPEPAEVGKTASHGCIRLTNWDAGRLAGWVRPGTEVVFRD